jgi:rhodanese-related sulfurtransferase
MDGNALPISPDGLYARVGTAKAPLLIDVRRVQAFEADDRLIIGSARRLPEDVSDWRKALPSGRSVVAYCVHGREVSQGVASAHR